jgi:chemotaxis protein CheZ
MARLSASRFAPDASFDGRLASLREEPAPVAEPAELERIVTSVVSTLSGGVSLGDLQLYHEVQALGQYIQSARREISGVRPDDINKQHLPMATDELDAVVTATAEATGVILAAMEEMEQLATKMPAKQARPLSAAVVRVYEACGFQDITGQRITKVVRTLKHIEGKIDALLAIFGGELDSMADGDPVPAPPPDKHASLLNGPALPSAGGNTQADIDALLASFD